VGLRRPASCALAAAENSPQQERPSDSEPERAPPAPDLDALSDEVIEAHNQIRAEAKLPALTVSGKLRAAAQRHARDMAKRSKMTHEGSDGSRPLDRIKRAGYHYRRAAENVAAGRFSVDRLMKVWMDSPAHKRNILGSFSQIGVACATDEDGKRYWCVTFGFPARR
jgi:uncharacterized protein YkwD